VNRRPVIVAIVASLAAMAAGCASIESEALRVNLAGISVVETSLLEQRYLLRVRLQNPGDRVLELDGFVYDLSLNGRLFARGVSDQSVVVPRFGEQLIELVASGSTGGAIRQVLELSSRKQVDYRLSGRAHAAGGRIHFDGQGDIPIPVQLFDLLK